MAEALIKRGAAILLLLLVFYGLFFEGSIRDITGLAIGNTSNETSKSINIKLEYKTNTIYDEDNNGIEPIGSPMDFTVENTNFNWAVDETKLCTKWAVYNIEDDILTAVCHGSSDCCAFVDLVPRRELWKDPLYLAFGELGSGFLNAVNAQVIYADYNISRQDLRADISYSDWTNLTGKFFLERIPFKNVCVDTCSLKGLNKTSLKLIVEIENAELSIDSVSYSIAEAPVKIKSNVSAEDSEGSISIDYRILKDGNLVSQASINPDLYEVEIIPSNKIIDKISFEDVNYTSPIRIGIDEIKKEVHVPGLDVNKKFAVDPSSIEFKNATLTSIASGNVLYKCRLWDFEKEVCFGEWEMIMDLVEGEAYNITLAKDDPAFVEGKKNITKIAIPAVNITENASNVQLVAYVPNITSFGKEDIIEEKVNKTKVVVGKPVKWVKKVRLVEKKNNATIAIANKATNITIKKIEENATVNISEENIKIKVNETVKNLEEYEIEKRIEQLQKEAQEKIDTAEYPIIINKINTLEQKKNLITGYAILEENENETTELIIEELVEEVLIEYETEGPKAEEANISETEKQVEISSDIIYENITAFTNLPFEAHTDAVKLFLLINNSRTEIDADKFDINNDGLIDYIEWTAPLSNQMFELKLVPVITTMFFNFSDEKISINYNLNSSKPLIVAPPETVQKEKSFGVIFNETKLKKIPKYNFDGEIYFNLSMEQNYVPTLSNPYMLERNLTGQKKQIRNQIGQVEERQFKRFLTFEDIFNKEHNIFDTITQEVNRTICLNITKAGKEKCALSTNQTVNLTRKQKRDVGFSLKKQGKNWLAAFSNLFDLDPSFVDDADSNWNAGTFNNMVVQGTGISANLTSSGVNISGSYGSQIFNANSTANWTNMTWVVEAPYGEEIGRSADSNAANIESGLINISGLVLLMYFNNESNFGENDSLVKDFSVDFNSNNYNQSNGTCRGISNCPTYNYTHKMLGAASSKFDGSDDKLIISTDSSIHPLNIVNTVSVSVWVYLLQYKESDILQKGLNLTTGGYTLWVEANGNLRWGAQASNNWVSATNDPDLNLWEHIAGTYNGSTLRLYINGELDNSLSVANAFTNVANLSIGHGWDGYLNGLVDELAIFNRTLSAQEIKNLYKRGALRLNLSARSCDDPACAGDAYKQLPINCTFGRICDLNLSSAGRYFQYNFTFSSNASSTNINRVVINNVSIEYKLVPIPPAINISLNKSLASITWGDAINITANISDDSGLSWCRFVINQTGAKEYFNKTANGTNDQCSQNFTISLTRRGVINFSAIVNDTSNNLNQSDQIIVVVSKEPSITLNAPANNSVAVANFNLLNVTVTDIDNDTMDVYIWGSNDSSQFNTSLLYMSKGLNNAFIGVNITYNWTSPVLQPDNLTLLLMHFDNRSEFGETTAGSGNRTFDFSDKANHGTIYGAVWNATGKLGGAFEFNGTDHFINSTLVQRGVTNYTIEAWVKTEANQGVIVNNRGAGAGMSITLAIGPLCGTARGTYCTGSAAGIPAIGVDSNGVWIGNNGLTAVNDGKWHHVVGVFNTTSGDSITPASFKVYVDGQLEAGNTATIGTATSPLTGANETRIGWHRPWLIYFNGTIDEVAVHNRTLSASEILDHYRLKTGTYYWKANATDYNVSSESATREFRVDTTAPIVNGTVNNTSPRLYDVINATFNATDNSGLSSGQIIINDTGSKRYFNFTLSGAASQFSQNFSVSCSRGCTINVTGIANDGFNVRQNETLLTVVNTPPTTPTIAFPSTDLKTNVQPLGLNATFVADADGDVLNISYYINGRLNQTSLTNTTLNASDGTYILNVSLSDGSDSTANVSVNFTIDSTKPFVNVSINNSAPRTGFAVNITANASDALGLSFCQFAINQTGAKEFFNKSINGNNDQCSQNFTITTGGSVINFSVIVNDTIGNINQTDLVIASVANTAPIIKVFNLSGFSVDPTEAGSTFVLISFNATDSDGVSEINASKAVANFTLGGRNSGIFRFNSSCANHTEGISVIINCTIIMRYYDNASSSWIMNLSVEDTFGDSGRNDSLNFTYNSLLAATIINSLLDFSNVTLNQNNAPSKAPIMLNSTGNTIFSLINLTAAQLVGVSNTSLAIQPESFIVNLSNSTTGAGQQLSNLSLRLIDITGSNASLQFGKEGASNISIFFFLDVPSSGLTSQQYNSTWNLTLLAS